MRGDLDHESQGKTTRCGRAREATSSRRRHEALLQPSNDTGMDRITRDVMGTFRHERWISESCKAEEDNVAGRVIGDRRTSSRRNSTLLKSDRLAFTGQSGQCKTRALTRWPVTRNPIYSLRMRTTGEVDLCCTVVG